VRNREGRGKRERGKAYAIWMNFERFFTISGFDLLESCGLIQVE